MEESNLTPEQYKQAIKNVDALYKKQKNLNEFTEKMKSTWGAISSTIFGISGAEWFTEVPKTTKDIAKQAEVLTEMKGSLSDIGKKLNQEVSNAIEGLVTKSGESIKLTLDDFKNTFKSKTDIMKSMLQNVSTGFETKEQKEEIAAMTRDIENYSSLGTKGQKKLTELMEKHGVKHKDIIKQAKKGESESLTFYNKLLGMMPELATIEDESLKKKYLIALAEGKIDGFLKENKEAGIAILATNSKIFESVQDTVEEFSNASKNVMKWRTNWLRQPKVFLI